MRPSTSTSPMLAVSSPAMIRSSVDLPQPEGPMSAVKEPASQTSDASRSAKTSRVSTVKVRVTPETSMSSVGTTLLMDQTFSSKVVSNIDRSAMIPMLFR
jgi:hypothetical protein